MPTKLKFLPRKQWIDWTNSRRKRLVLAQKGGWGQAGLTNWVSWINGWMWIKLHRLHSLIELSLSECHDLSDTIHQFQLQIADLQNGHRWLITIKSLRKYEMRHQYSILREKIDCGPRSWNTKPSWNHQTGFFRWYIRKEASEQSCKRITRLLTLKL